MNLLGPDIRTLEVHPVPFTRLLHRYPPSGRWERDGLGVPLLLAALSDAASLGYTSLQIAGDEPLHCPALHSLCAEGHRHGMKTMLHVRQIQLNQRLLEELRGSIDVLGVVLDSKPSAHSRVRKCPHIRKARELGIGVAVIIRLTQTNMNELEWAAQFAVEHGASTLSVRARNISGDQLATAWMVLEFLRDVCRGRVRVGFEAPNRYCLPIESHELFEWQRRLAAQPEMLPEILSPLVIDPDGIVLPLRARFPREFALGDLRRHSLRELADFWIANRSAEFVSCYQEALIRALGDSDESNDFFDLLSEEAGRSPAAALAAAG
jgi:Fe-coproporphyrin III synthase